MSGDLDVSSIVPIGDPFTDGLLHGIFWKGPITYGTFFSINDYNYSLDFNGNGRQESITPLSETQMKAVRWVLEGLNFSVESFTNLDISLANQEQNIRFANEDEFYTINRDRSWANKPGNTVRSGDVWFSPGARTDLLPGTYSWYTTLHETGHSLGLKHPHLGTREFGKFPSDYDSFAYTVMSYRDFPGDDLLSNTRAGNFPQTYMMYDILALQTLYGADYNTNSGNTVYSWDTLGNTYINGQLTLKPFTNKIFMTIWDGGGIDTYDCRAFSSDQIIDLNPGKWSTFSFNNLAKLGSIGGAGEWAPGNVANSLLFEDNTASLIENAIGGSGNDIFIGNATNNYFLGGLGNDSFYGGLGRDYFNGGPGADRFIFSTALSDAEYDVIGDFRPEEGDKIVLDRSVFSELMVGELNDSAFKIGHMAVDADDRIIYDEDDGSLKYDSDGIGPMPEIQFAIVWPGFSVSAADFIIA